MAPNIQCFFAVLLMGFLVLTAESTRSIPLRPSKSFLQTLKPGSSATGRAATNGKAIKQIATYGRVDVVPGGEAARAVFGRAADRAQDSLGRNGFLSLLSEQPTIGGYSDDLDLELPLLPTVTLSDLKEPHGPAAPDKYAWLEDVTSDRSLSWVKMQNNRTLSSVGSPAQSPLMTQMLNILESKDKIPYVTAINGFLYNLWTDEQHQRGLWRRTTLKEYEKRDPEWETVLDLDALGKAEGESWVWKGHVTLEEPGVPHELVLLQLSHGGADAVVVREFNLTAKSFVPPPSGFFIKESKTDVNYVDRNMLMVGTDMGPGSMTSSGYPRQVRAWKRGTPLQDAPVVFEGQDSDMNAYAYRVHERRNCVYEWRSRQISFYSGEHNLKIVAGPGAGGDFQRLDVPSDVGISTFADQLLLSLRSQYSPAEGVSFPAGGLIATSLADFMAGERKAWTELFQPTENTTLTGFTSTRDFVVLQVLDNVKGSLASWKYADDGQWKQQFSNSAVQIESISAWAFDGKESNAIWIQSQSFLSPPTLMLAPSASDTSVRQSLKSLPTQFDATGFVASQRWAISEDGTHIPYFLVKRADAPANQPTLLYGYGGFEIPQMPYYMSIMGPAWLTQGGVFALANIRGGGEYGPDWHQAALKKNKHKSYEDFAAIAKDLSNAGITSPSKLGIMGGSNGGLLVGNMLVKYPQLFGAVVCQVPLLDMWRYDKLLAGQSWTAEYGDPDDPKEWDFLRTNSPYHLITPKIALPPALFVTSTRDDRVHPGHARKMVAKLQELSNVSSARHIFLFENMEGGHGGAADSNQRAFVKTLEFEFLWKSLGPARSKSGVQKISTVISTLTIMFSWLSIV